MDLGRQTSGRGWRGCAAAGSGQDAQKQQGCRQFCDDLLVHYCLLLGMVAPAIRQDAPIITQIVPIGEYGLAEFCLWLKSEDSGGKCLWKVSGSQDAELLDQRR